VTTLDVPPPPIPVRVDLPETYGADPVEMWQWLHRYAPVYWFEERQFWIVSGWEHVRTVVRDDELFTSTRGNQFVPRDERSGRDVKYADAVDERIKVPRIIDMDGEQHAAYRRLISKSMTPRLIRTLETKIRVLIEDILSPVDPNSTLDVVESLAVPLPTYMISELLGVPIEDRDDFRRWSEAIIAQSRADGMPPTKELEEMFPYFEDLLQQRTKEPKDDLLSTLAQASGSNLNYKFAASELIQLCTTLLAGGNETTRNLISGGVHALLDFPDERRKLVAHPEIVDNAVEEMLRYVCPVRYFGRVAMRDTELGGQQIKEGDAIFMYFSAANRDPSVYPDPDRLDLTRDLSKAPHLSFASGPHFCAGAHLARLETSLFFTEFHKRFPDYELAGDVVTEPNLISNITLELPIRLRSAS
jgi:cholest-4-en-3-one 26-monooxygenase